MKLILFLLLALTFSVQAHEGHNHGPGQVQPIKGGVILKADHFYLEVVGTHTEIRIFPLDMKLKALPLDKIKISASYKLPRAKKAETVSLKSMSDHFHGQIDSKNTHRYQVDVSIEALGEKELLTYQIEPEA